MMRTRDEVLREFPNAQRVLTGERTVWRDKLAPEIDRMADHIVAVERQRDEYHRLWKAEVLKRREVADRIRELEADAKRYRWLRERLHGVDWDYDTAQPRISVLTFKIPDDMRVSANLDATIDHAMTPEVDRG